MLVLVGLCGLVETVLHRTGTVLRPSLLLSGIGELVDHGGCQRLLADRGPLSSPGPIQNV